jgi:regulator of sigma E protease
VRTTIASSKGDSLEFKIDRDGEIKEIILYPENQIMIGFYTEASTGLFTALKGALFRTVFYVKLMFQLILMLFSGQASSDAIAGPVGIISMVGEAARLGIYPLMNLAAFISINLGFMNLLPIPALDGSRLMFILIEGIRGKRIPPEKEGYIHFVGFVFLMTLMFFVLYKDIIKLLN